LKIIKNDILVVTFVKKGKNWLVQG